MRQKLLTFCIALLTIAGLQACEQKSAYQQLVERHYDPAAQNDSLFLGYHFGMSRQEFYDHSWSLNRKKIVREGNTNQSVRYEVTDLKSRAKMNFFPVFYQDSIYSMPVKYSYTGWAPWNKDLWADTLAHELANLFEKKHGYNFEYIDHPQRNMKAYFTIIGNKQISIYPIGDNQHVAVVYTDLNVANRIKEKGNDQQ